MPKATTGGVTDQNVDPDYVAPAGMPPADALDQGIEDAATGETPKPAPDAPDTGPREQEREQDAQRQQGQRQAGQVHDKAQVRKPEDKPAEKSGQATKKPTR